MQELSYIFKGTPFYFFVQAYMLECMNLLILIYAINCLKILVLLLWKK
jgi:hypothetical protein